MLKLQDLTEPDIRKYVSDKLDQAPLKASQIIYEKNRQKSRRRIPVGSIRQ